jgi:hypothetical protein
MSVSDVPFRLSGEFPVPQLNLKFPANDESLLSRDKDQKFGPLHITILQD